MARNTSYNAQARTLQMLSVSPRIDATVLEFKTEEWSTGHVFVKRVYQPNHVSNMAYVEGFVVGQRGAIKTLYSRFDTI